MFLDDMVTLLVDAGVGIGGVSIFRSSGAVLPKMQNSIIQNGFLTLRQYSGAAPWIMEHSDTTPAYERPNAQIVSHAKFSAQSELLAQRAWNVFVQKRGLTINSVYYLKIDVKQSPFDMGADAEGLIQFVFNIEVTKRPTPIS